MPNGEEMGRRAYLVQKDNGHFFRLPDMNQTRFDSGCGVVYFPQTKQRAIVMAGGYASPKTTEMFVLDQDNEVSTWVEGPPLIRAFSYNPSVNPDDSTLMLVGGLDSTAGYFRNDMLSLNVEKMQWEGMPGKIDTQGTNMTFFGI